MLESLPNFDDRYVRLKSCKNIEMGYFDAVVKACGYNCDEMHCSSQQKRLCIGKIE